MKKIPTLLPKDPNDLGRVIPGEVNQKVTHFSIKIDGTSCMIRNGLPYCRYDAKLFKKKNGKLTSFTIEEIMDTLPQGSIPCQAPDQVSGHWPHWIPVLETNPEQQYILEGYKALPIIIDGTYECIGPKIQGNPHGEETHIWIQHTSPDLIIAVEYWQTDPYNTFKSLFENFPWEGLVAYNGNEPIAKIRRSDFGYEKTKYLSTKTLDK